MKKFIFLSCLICLAFTAEAQLQTNIRQVMNVNATATSTKVLDANKDRNYLAIENDGGGSILVKFDEVHTANEGFRVKNGEIYTFPVTPINSVWIKSQGGGTEPVVIVEGVK